MHKHFNIITYFIIIFAFVHTSCDSDHPYLQEKIITLPTNDILTSICIDDFGNKVIIGGNVWHYGLQIIVTSGSKIKMDTFSDKLLFDIFQDKDKTLYTAGVDGYLYSKSAGQISWEFHRLKDWDILHHITAKDDGRLLLSGGKSYSRGYIYHIDKNLKTDTVIYFPHEISAVQHISAQKFLQAGYGILMYSENNGYSWEDLGIQGDFFSAIAFRDSLYGLVTGFNGSLLKTSDGGKSFIWFQKPNGGTRHRSYRMIKYLGGSHWLIGGNYGKIFLSNDHGESWQTYQLKKNTDIYDAAIHQDSIWLVGTEGYLAGIPVPR
jgi:hypothetical protein